MTDTHGAICRALQIGSTPNVLRCVSTNVLRTSAVLSNV